MTADHAYKRVTTASSKKKKLKESPYYYHYLCRLRSANSYFATSFL